MTTIAHEGEEVPKDDSLLVIHKDGKFQVRNSSVQPSGIYSLEDVARARGWTVDDPEPEPRRTFWGWVKGWLRL